MGPVALITNRNVTPNVTFQVSQVGTSDYRVTMLGIGEYSHHEFFGDACVKARWLASLAQCDLNHEIAKVVRRVRAAAKGGG